MNPTIESTRFGEYCINVYRVGDSCFLVCGRQTPEESCFTQTVFCDCRQPRAGLIGFLQEHLRAIEESDDFQDWRRRVSPTPWDFNNSRCPLCFVACRQAAKELRELMGSDYDRFLAASLRITVHTSSTEAEGGSLRPPGVARGPSSPNAAHLSLPSAGYA